MAEHETFIERLIPGDLEHQIPAAVQKVLPGGFRNRLLQGLLGLLIAFGFSFMVRRMLEKREAKRQALAPAPPYRPLPPARDLAGPAPAPPPIVSPPPAAPEGPAARDALLAFPHIALSGPIDQAMYASFRAQLAAAPPEGGLVVSLSTSGGDPEIARLIGEEIRLLREYGGRDALFLGKVALDSAGTVLMAAFPVDRRYLTRGTRILIEERRAPAPVAACGPLKAQAASLSASLREVEEAMRVEEADWRALVAGSRLQFDALRERAAAGWPIGAAEARDLGLVHDVI